MGGRADIMDVYNVLVFVSHKLIRVSFFGQNMHSGHASASQAAATQATHCKSQPHGQRTASRNHMNRSKSHQHGQRIANCSYTARVQLVAAARVAHHKSQPPCQRIASRSHMGRALQVAAARAAHHKSQPHGQRIASRSSDTAARAAHSK
jgi:hypothetical protein